MLCRWGRVGVAAVAIAVGASTATAQFGGFGGANYRTSINDNEIDRMIDALGLDEDQATLVDALYDGFRDTFDQASEDSRQKMRDTFQELRDSGDFQSMATAGITFGREWKQQSESLEQSFFNDVKTVLTEDQAKKWPKYERDWRRRNSFRSGGQPGSFSGENVDLYQIVEDMELDEEARGNVEPVLDAYSLELDPALTNRDRAMTDMTSITSSVLAGKTTVEELDSKFKNLQRMRVQVRDLNDRYVQLLASHMTPEKGQELQQEYLQRCFRGIYSPTPADNYFETVRKSGTLNEAQIKAIDAIEQDFHGQADGINRQLADLQKKQEVELQQRMFDSIKAMAQQGGFGQGGPGQRGRGNFGGGGFGGQGNGADDPRRALMDQKTALVQNALNAVAGLLSPEQLAAAPKPDANQRGARGGNRGQMTDEQRQQMEERVRQWRDRGGDQGGDRGGRGGRGG